MSDTVYRVDNLLRNLNLYKEDITAKEVIQILKEDRLKYLTQLVDPDDINIGFYNTKKLPIDFGDLKGIFSLKEINELYKVFLDYTKEYEKSSASANDIKLHGSFRQFTQWNICEVDSVTIEITRDIGSSKTPIGQLYKEFSVPPTASDSLAREILMKIYTHEKIDTIKTGKTIVNLKLKISQWEVRSVSAGIEFLIIRNINYILNALKSRGINVSLNLVNMSRVYGAIRWTYELYEMTKLSYTRYSSLMVQNNSNSSLSKKLMEQAKREILIDKLGIEEGDLVFFSLVQFSEACRRFEMVGQKSYNIEEGVEETVKSGKRELSASSVFLAKVSKITEEFLILNLRYCSGGKWTFVDFPVKWSILLPDLTLAKSTNAIGETSVIEHSLTRESVIDNFFNYALDIPVLLTKKNCSFFDYPTNIIIESNF